jgi:hypothetical protein
MWPFSQQEEFGPPIPPEDIDGIGRGGTPPAKSSTQAFLDGLATGFNQVPLWQVAAGAFVLSLVAFGAIRIMRK